MNYMLSQQNRCLYYYLTRPPSLQAGGNNARLHSHMFNCMYRHGWGGGVHATAVQTCYDPVKLPFCLILLVANSFNHVIQICHCHHTPCIVLCNFHWNNTYLTTIPTLTLFYNSFKSHLQMHITITIVHYIIILSESC